MKLNYSYHQPKHSILLLNVISHKCYWLLFNKYFFHLFAVPPKIVTLRKPEPVRAGELLQLACTAKDSNPKTTLVWFRQDNPIPDGAGKYKY